MIKKRQTFTQPSGIKVKIYLDKDDELEDMAYSVRRETAYGKSYTGGLSLAQANLLFFEYEVFEKRLLLKELLEKNTD